MVESAPTANGISVFATEDQARRQAQEFAILGTFIAAVQIPVGGAFQYERTGQRRGEVWGLNPGNLISDHETEAEALAAVRELLAVGWLADDLALGLGLGDDDPEDVPLPPAITGPELSARALAAKRPDPGKTRRSA